MSRTLGENPVSTVTRPVETQRAANRAETALVKNLVAGARARRELAGVQAAHDPKRVPCPECGQLIVRAFMARHQEGLLCRRTLGRTLGAVRSDDRDRIRYNVETPAIQDGRVSAEETEHGECCSSGAVADTWPAPPPCESTCAFVAELRGELRELTSDGRQLEETLDAIARAVGYPASELEDEPAWRAGLVAAVQASPVAELAELRREVDRLRALLTEERDVSQRARGWPGPLALGAYAATCPQCGAPPGCWCARPGEEPCAGRREAARLLEADHMQATPASAPGGEVAASGVV